MVVSCSWECRICLDHLISENRWIDNAFIDKSIESIVSEYQLCPQVLTI